MRAKFILGILVLLASCDPVDLKLRIKNETDQKIYFMTCPARTLNKMYRDEVKSQGNNLNYRNYIKEMRPHSIEEQLMMGHRGKAWENYVNHCENGKLRIFIFSIDTLNKYNWKDINENERYLTKREFSVEDLNKLNWEIRLP
jgi:hypothetical protein